MASHRLEDDLGYSPVNEVRQVWEQESAKDQEQESMTGIALIGSRCRCHRVEERPIGEPRDPDAVIPSLVKLFVYVLGRYAEEAGELTPNGANSVPRKLNTACSGSQNSMAVLKKNQSTGVSVNMTISPMMPRMKA
ncbi:hypothetical protein CRG98_017613 [Punica granatum]|uniref:Uncharacterized protein n=1 Tax=Punica granatum TaxID=22663 RepID=A0A2I0K093_PUNGR|nr:hypothetical protein CRG98_017613 [Punica granatum]